LVLLRNEGVLPWRPEAVRRVLVVGRLADTPNLGDHGSSRVYPPRVVTPLAGLRAAAPAGCAIDFEPGDDLARVRARAAEADAVLVVAGYTHEDEGEYIPAPMADPQDPTKTVGGDRLDLGLGAEQEALVLAAAEAHPETVVAVMAGSAVTLEAWRERVGAILMLWYPGMEGGHALADVLFGRVNPAGRLPFTIPKRADDLPFFDRDATAIEYDLWHGYTKLERDGIAPAFPFGFGLSYTDFAFGDAAAQLDGDVVRVAVDVENTGGRAGETVVQVYAGPAEPSPEHPRRRLCGFRRVALAPGARERVAIDVATKDLAWFDEAARRWRLGAPEWRFRVGPSSAEGEETVLAIPERTWTIRER
ncbi:MAG TPA: glycoside hydrolase family 3 C-terminal domain-containing protein, partial [Myxococcota bacterium]|nr:glycoside hydrolase family 3 C-terminal domain-containing protein [Myxococcota bacterium]